MRPFQVVFLIVTSACTVQAACEKITDCRECLSFRCVWYELPNKSICGNNIIPKFSFTTKIRNAALCPRTQIERVLAPLSSPPIDNKYTQKGLERGTMTTSNNHTDLQHQTNQYHETTQSEGTTTVFPQATTEIRKSFKVNTQEDPTSTRLPAHDFQEETDPTSVSISKEVASYWPPAASKTKRDHDQRIPKEAGSSKILVPSSSTSTSTQPNDATFNDNDMNIGPTESPPSELTTSSYESQTAIVNLLPSSITTTMSQAEKKARRELLKHQCGQYASYRMLKLARKGQIMTKEDYKMMIKKCFRTML